MVKSEVWDLIVVGAGYWGAATAHEARKLGWSVLVLDDRDAKAGSRNASAICDPHCYFSSVFSKYWPSDWDRSELAESLSWLIDHGGVSTQEGFWNRFQNRSIRTGAQAIYLAANTVITDLAKAKRAKVLEILDGQTKGVVTTELTYAARRVCIAGGYRTGSLTSDQVVPEGLYGRGLIVHGKTDLELPVSVMIKPYVKHTIRRWGTGYRVGDTAEKSPNNKQLENLRTVAQSVLSGYEEELLVEGYRPVMDRFTVCSLSDGIAVATGGHRLGLGLSGLVARKVLEILR